jgi:hypothetical protein
MSMTSDPKFGRHAKAKPFFERGEGGIHGTCDWGGCHNPANKLRDDLPICDECDRRATAEPASEKGEGLRTVCAKCGVDSRDSSQKYCGDGRDKENEHRWVRAPDDAAANRSRQTSDQARQFQDWLWNTGGASTINLAHAIAAKAAEIFGSPPASPEVIDKSFSCPECGGTHFGTADASMVSKIKLNKKWATTGKPIKE